MARNIRLSDSTKRQVRVRDLAKELDLEPKAVMAFLEGTGEFVRSPSSNIEEPVAHKVRAAFAPPLAPGEAESRSPTRPKTTTATEPTGLSAPRKRSRRDNNPYIQAQDRPRDRNQLLNRSPEEIRARLTKGKPDERYVSTTDSGVDDYSMGAYRPSPTFEDPEWGVRGIGDSERDDWLANGFERHHARIAEECVQSGILPSDLGSEIDGYAILYRVTHGEPPSAVAQRWREVKSVNED